MTNNAGRWGVALFLGLGAGACVSPRGESGLSGRHPSSVASARCTSDFSELVDEARREQVEFRAIFKARAGRVHQLLKGARDKTRHWLQVWNHHPYPVVAIDDWPLAYGWARLAYGALTPEQQQILKLDEIWNTVRSEIAKVESYPRDIETMTQRAVDLNLQIGGLESYLQSGHAKKFHAIELVMPTLRGDEVGTTKRYFGTLVKLEIELKKLKSELAALRTEAFKRGVEHATAVRRLETYRHELLAARAEFNGRPAPQEFRSALQKIESFYKDRNAEVLRDAYKPSEQAWNSLKWIQWRAELRAYFLKTMPHEKAVEKSREILAFIKTLKPEELRALGLDDVADDIKLVARAKWVRLGVGASTGLMTGGGFVGGGVKVFSTVKEYLSDGQGCVESGTEDEFYKCLDDYLRRAHPGKYILKRGALENALVNGELSDPEINDTVQSMLDRRMTYFVEKNAESEMSAATRRYLARMNMRSEEYRQRLISETDEKWFRARLLSSDPKTGYLALKYPLIFRQPEVKKLIEQALGVSGFESKKTLLVELEAMPAAEALRKDLLDLLENRERYQSQYRQSLELKRQLKAGLFGSLTLEGEVLNAATSTP